VPARDYSLVPALFIVALAATGCGDDTTPGQSGPDPAAAAATESAAPVDDQFTTGTWTSEVPLHALFTDGRVIIGMTRPAPGDPVEIVAVSPDDGSDLWTARPPAPDDAVVTNLQLRFGKDIPALVSWTQEILGTGISPAETDTRVAALDPASGDVLWEEAGGELASASPTAVLLAVADAPGDDETAVALDPASGRQLWTSGAAPLLVRDDVAVLSQAADGGVSTVLIGADAATGQQLWTSASWSADAVGSRSFVHAAVPGRAVVETTITRLAGETTTMRTRDLRTGESVGDELPEPNLVAGLTDHDAGTAVLYDDSGAASTPHGVYAVDTATGSKLWELTPEQSTAAFIAGAGLVWVQGLDGIVAVDATTGDVRAQGLAAAPVLVLTDTQILIEPTGGLRSEPLP
jgi:outer membrane protein assembly factor BamB